MLGRFMAGIHCKGLQYTECGLMMPYGDIDLG